MRKRKRRLTIKINWTTIIVIFAITLVLASTFIFLGKSLHRKRISVTLEKPQEVYHPEVSPKIIGTNLIIKGCLFELGILKEQFTEQEHTITIKPQKKYTIDQLSSAFQPLTKYGNVDVRDPKHVMINLSGENWEIELVYPEKDLTEVIPPKHNVPIFSGAHIAIIVDDMGPDMKEAEQLASIDGDLTFSVMPLRPHTQEVARYLHEKGHEVMLHLPMQGAAGFDPGEGAIFKGMAPDQIRIILSKRY